jgi:hypothetical protein
VEALVYTSTLAQSLFAPALVVTMFYKADAILSSEASKAISQAIQDVAARPEESKWSQALEDFLSEYFPPQGNPGKFWLSVFVLTSVSLIFFLAIYTARSTGLVDQLLNKGFLLQFIGNGLLITLLINSLAYSQYRHLLKSFASSSLSRNILWILADFCMKAILFIAITAVIYAVFTITRHAFSGDLKSAMRAVPITIREALFFRNLTAVYIYSLLLSSFPIFVAVIVKLLILSPSFAKIVQRMLFFFPIAEKPLRAAAIVFAVFAGGFCFVMSVILSPLVQAASM